MALVGVGMKALNAPEVHTKPEVSGAASPAKAHRACGCPQES